MAARSPRQDVPRSVARVDAGKNNLSLEPRGSPDSSQGTAVAWVSAPAACRSCHPGYGYADIQISPPALVFGELVSSRKLSTI